MQSCKQKNVESKRERSECLNPKFVIRPSSMQHASHCCTGYTLRRCCLRWPESSQYDYDTILDYDYT